MLKIDWNKSFLEPELSLGAPKIMLLISQQNIRDQKWKIPFWYICKIAIAECYMQKIILKISKKYVHYAKRLKVCYSK